MSKFKYTSQLSSQYHKVFQSYHSLDRYESQLKLNLSKSLHRETKNTQIIHPNLRPDVRYKIKYFEKKRPNTQQRCKTDYNEKLLGAKSQNKFHSQGQKGMFENLSDLLQKLNNQEENFNSAEVRYNNFAQNGVRKPTNANPLNLKVANIVKRRNEIKLKVRVNDLQRINKKYNYLEDYKEKINLVQRKITEKQSKKNSFNQNQSHLCNKKIGPTQSQSQGFSYNDFDKAQPYQKTTANEPHMSYQRHIDETKVGFEHGLIQRNRNLPIWDKSQKLNSIFSRGSLLIPQQKKYPLQQQKQEENIKTPHFSRTLYVQKEELPQGLIHGRLSKLVKNTFSDRY